MNSRMLSWKVYILFLTIFLMGCSQSAPSPVPSDKALIHLNIDWSKLKLPNEKIQQASVLDVHDTINAVGARLVYPKDNATFTQAVSKEVAQTQGVITLEVPATNKAHLYLVAVNTEIQTAFYYGLAENLRLEADSILAITIDDFKWVEAEWIIEEKYIGAIENKHFKLPHNEEEAIVDIAVRDPFQAGKRASYDTSFIFHYGISSMRENTNGWLAFDAYFRKPAPNTPNADRHWMQPYVDGSLFNLGNKGYYIPPVIRDVRVDWNL